MSIINTYKILFMVGVDFSQDNMDAFFDYAKTALAFSYTVLFGLQGTTFFLTLTPTSYVLCASSIYRLQYIGSNFSI